MYTFLDVVAPGELLPPPTQKKLFLLVFLGFVCKAATKACLRNNTHINKGLPVMLLVVLYFWSVKLEA